VTTNICIIYTILAINNFKNIFQYEKKKNYTSAYIYYLLRHFCTIANTVKFPQRSRNSQQRDTIMKTILKKLRLLNKTKYLFTFIAYIYTALEFYMCVYLDSKSVHACRITQKWLLVYSNIPCNRLNVFFILFVF